MRTGFRASASGFRLAASGFAVRGSGFRVQRRAAWRLGWLALLLVLGLSASPLRAEPARVIALAPHLAELVFAAGAGDALVGTVAWSDYPPEASALPVIGDAFRLDLERILGLDPHLALAWEGGTPIAAAERLSELGIEVVWIRTRSLDDIAEALIELGQRLGQAAAGRAAADRFLSALAQRAPAPQAPLVAAFYQVSERPLFTLGGRHIINESFARCGAYNVFADLDIEAVAVDLEAVLARQPQLIVAGQDGSQADPLARWQRERAALPANLRLLTIDPDILIRPTPRIIAGIDRLCATLGASEAPLR